MYVYDIKEKIFINVDKIPEEKIVPRKKETKEIKSILKTSKNKTTKVQVIEPPPINQSYLTYSDDILYKIAKKNIHDSKKFINKYKLKNSFLHFSMKPMEKLETATIHYNILTEHNKKSIYYKPNGLWLSHGTSWLEYVENNIKIPSNLNLFPYIYKIEIFDSVKLITNKDDLFKFIKMYKRKPSEIKFYDILDWTRIRKDWDGLIITPWLGNKIWHSETNVEKFEIIGGEVAHEFIAEVMGARWKSNILLLSEWYRKWGCAGGVIWNINGIASCELKKKIDFSKYV